MVADALPRSEDFVKDAAQALVGKTIDRGRIYLHSVVGSGSFGVVFLGYGPREISTGQCRPFAVKCLRKPSEEQERERGLIEREIRHHRVVSSHEGVVTLHNVFEDDTWYYVVLDYCPEGDLFHEIVQLRRFYGNDYLIKDAFLQLLDAVEYCHEKSIFHRDLKPENVLCLESGQRMLLTDFGLSTTTAWCTEFGCGSGYYMSPEVQGGTSRLPYSAAQADIWSLGVILVNLVTGRNPWKRAEPGDSVYDYFLRDSDALGKVLPISPEVNTLLKRIFVHPDRRLSIPEIREGVLGINRFLRADSPTTVQSWQDTLEQDRLAVHHRIRKQPVRIPPPGLPEALDTRPVSPERLEGHHRHILPFLSRRKRTRTREVQHDTEVDAARARTSSGPMDPPFKFSFEDAYPPHEEQPVVHHHHHHHHAPPLDETEYPPRAEGDPLTLMDMTLPPRPVDDLNTDVVLPSTSRQHRRSWLRQTSFAASAVRRPDLTSVDGPPAITVDADDVLEEPSYPPHYPSDSSSSEHTPSPITPRHAPHDLTQASLSPSQYQHRFAIREDILSSSVAREEEEEERKGTTGTKRKSVWGWIHRKAVPQEED